MLTSSMPAEIEHWLLNNRGSTVYILRENQSLRSIINDTLEPTYDMQALLPAIDASRVIKDDDEISAIRQAIRISSLAHRTVLHNITTLKSEAEIEALFIDVCIAHDALWQAYPPIVASGSNASILHYTEGKQSLAGQNLLCLDAGCEWECYTCDITRTFPLQANGWRTQETAEIYALVEDMQDRCIEMMGPGVRYLDAFLLADKIAVQGLLRLGIFKDGTVDELIESGAVRAVFPHGLGHHMGLDVHDVSAKPILSFARETSTMGFKDEMPWNYAPCTSSAPLLEPGMVITVEPGICRLNLKE